MEAVDRYLEQVDRDDKERAQHYCKTYIEREEDADEREDEWQRLNLYGDDSDDYDEWDLEQFAPCSCPYCNCGLDLKGGGVCDDCAAGAHQG